jgi:hypothetical protein
LKYSLVCSQQSIEITGINPKQLLNLLVIHYFVLTIQLGQWFCSLNQKWIKFITKRNIILEYALLCERPVGIKTGKYIYIVFAFIKTTFLFAFEFKILKHLPYTLWNIHRSHSYMVNQIADVLEIIPHILLVF